MNITIQQQQEPSRRGKWQSIGHSFKESNYVTDFWNWLVKLLSKSAELVLFGSVLYSGYQMLPNITHANQQVDAIVFVIQQAALDIGGLGLLKIAKRAGLPRDSFPMRVGIILVGLMICNVILATIKQVLPSTPEGVFLTIETLLLIARSIMAVLYGHAIHALREEHGDAPVTHHDMGSIQESITALAQSIPVPEQIDYQAIAAQLVPLLNPALAEMKNAVLEEMKTTEPEPQTAINHAEIARAMEPQFRRVIVEEIRTALPQIVSTPVLGTSVPRLEPRKQEHNAIQEDAPAMPPQSRTDADRDARLEQAYQSLLKDGKAVSGDSLRELAHCSKGAALAWLRARKQVDTGKIDRVVLEPVVNGETGMVQ